NTAFEEYKAEVIKVIGDKKHAEVEERAAVNHMIQNAPPATPASVIVLAGGDELIYDMWGGRYFRGNIETIRQHVNQFNSDLLNGNMCDDLNSFYHLLGLAPVDSGNGVGFNLQTMVDVGFGSHMSEDGRPAIAMFFRTKPVADFTKI